MPRYDYQCQTCYHTFEVRQAFSSEPVANCPVCDNGARRLIHSVPVVFKGSGWYVNDYGKGGSASSPTSDSKGSGAEKQDSKSKSKSKSKSESGSDSKSESKSGSSKETAAT